MHYLVKFRVENPANWEGAYLSPEGDWGWTIIEAGDEEDARKTLEDREVEEMQPLVPAREYVAVHEARAELEESKKRFVDDPSGALQEARKSVGRAMEARGYSKSDGETSKSRRELAEEYERADVGESGNLEDRRNAFSRLSGILERLTRT